VPEASAFGLAGLSWAATVRLETLAATATTNITNFLIFFDFGVNIKSPD
jgi:hypothetical protein